MQSDDKPREARRMFSLESRKGSYWVFWDDFTVVKHSANLPVGQLKAPDTYIWRVENGLVEIGYDPPSSPKWITCKANVQDAYAAYLSKVMLDESAADRANATG